MDTPENTDNIKENLKNSNVWKRLLFMLLFSILYSAAEVVLALVVLYQFFSLLITGNKNEKVLSLGAQISTYAYQVFSFLTFNSEEMPFPISDWPNDKPLTAKATRAPRKPATKKAPAKKTVRKTTPKKAAPKAAPDLDATP